MTQYYLTSQNLIPKKLLKLPHINKNNVETQNQLDLLQYSNLFIQSPQKSIKINAPKLKKKIKRIEPKNNLNETLQQRQSDQDQYSNYYKQKKKIFMDQEQERIKIQKINKYNQLRQKQEEERLLVHRELKKFKPQNSSLTLGYLQKQREIKNKLHIEQFQKEFQDQIKQKSHRLNKKSLDKLLSPLGRKNTDSKIETDLSMNKLNKIIEGYTNEKIFLEDIKSQRDTIQKKLLKQYETIEQKYNQNALSQRSDKNYKMVEETDEKQRKIFKKQIQQLSLKCQIISRSIKKKNL